MMKKVIEARIEELLGLLTLEEKIGMIHADGVFQSGGVKRLDIPPLIMSDGPMGVRKQFNKNDWINIGTTDDLVSYLPSNSALASTWNRDIAFETGQVLGAEARGRGKDVILAPGINIKRSPLCGRNFEYMSEDPKLIEEMVVPLIKGIQENDVAACVKHFAANSQETERLWVDTFVDERPLREIYFAGFKAAVQKGESYTLMGAYNRLRGEHCSQSKYLLTEILRDEWNFDGAVISDWGAIHDTKNAAESGLDIEMSVTPDFDDYYMAKPLLKAVKNGEIEEGFLDKKIKNILRTLYRLNLMGEGKENRKSGTYNAPIHRERILNGARESIILLKNEDNRLPLKRNTLKTLAVIGRNAEMIHSNGGGSAEIKALYEISPLMGLKTKLGGNVEVKYAKGYYIPSKKDVKELNWQQHSLEREKALTEAQKAEARAKQGLTEKEIITQRRLLLEEAVALAKETDEVIIIGGLNHDFDVEGQDRKDMLLPYGQDTLIEEILKVNPNTIITMIAGSPVQMSAWSSRAKAIVWSWYAGMESGTALADVLFGDVNPSGKLPETLPKKLEDSPAHKFGEFGTTKTVTYQEGLYVGYRYYDSYQVEPEFCFGHGLSYTSFEYKDLQVLVKERVLPVPVPDGRAEAKEEIPDEMDKKVDAGNAVGIKEDEEVEVTIAVTVKNTGAVDGAEAIQVYVSDIVASVERPVQELKGFTKVFLKAGEERIVTVTLHKNAFGFYDTDQKCFKAEAGEFEIRVGSSSRDLRAAKTIKLSMEYQYQ